MKNQIILICLLAFATQAIAQGTLTINAGEQEQKTTMCVSDEYWVQQVTTSPEVAARVAAIEEHTRNYVANQLSSSERASGAVITIPVVFHVLYQNATENISDAQIATQMAVLNEDFRALNADIISAEPEFAPLAADFEIEFCLADTDPNGNPTNGITRTSTTVNKFNPLNDNAKKNGTGGKSPWPSDDYLNVWVCDLDDIYLGYATFPGGDPLLDGVVCDYITIGTIGTATAPYDLGRVTVHEIGHWLNLQHIWGNCLIPFFGCCGIDDQVADTPVQNNSSSGCPLSQVSCGSKDNVQNYMDYTDDACSVMFTEGQKTRARALFAPGGSRVSLLTSPGCSASPDPCDAPVNLAMALTPPSTGVASWDAVPAANNYTLEGCLVGGPCTFFTTASNSITYNNFKSGRDYEFRVQANCDAGVTSGFSSWFAFSTPSPRFAINYELSVYPNPAVDLLNVKFAQLSEPGRLVITDLSGREIISPIQLEVGQRSAQAQIGELEAGIYMLGLYIGNRLVENSQFNVMK